jgi:hypothetical protein
MTCDAAKSMDRSRLQNPPASHEALKDRVLEVDRRYRSGELDFFHWSSIMSSLVRAGGKARMEAARSLRGPHRIGATSCS